MVPWRSKDRNEIGTENALHFSAALKKIVVQALGGPVRSAFTSGALFLPVDMPPAMLVPVPEVLSYGRRPENFFQPGLAEPCGNDRHSKRDPVESKEPAQSVKSLAGGSDMIGSKKNRGQYGRGHFGGCFFKHHLPARQRHLPDRRVPPRHVGGIKAKDIRAEADSPSHRATPLRKKPKAGDLKLMCQEI